ncbi:MAG: M23 family metallopeptidase [Ruminococcus sp.]|nr:M23 family metallopeptidase [Ruminococcus sp.]
MKISKEVILQGLKQSFCIPLIYIKHKFKLPDQSQLSKVEYRLPFDGEWTVVNGGIEKEYSHSWSVPTQRYAYDFMIMDENGKTYDGENIDDIKAYKCYGNDVLAPADGIVVEIGNNCEDSKIMLPDNIEATAKDIRGNYILIKHTEKEYGFIGHLQPQSICVKVGESVKAGQIIAKCGNTGNSSEPHIHFHVQDGVDFFTSAGIPIRFKNICVSNQSGYSIYDNRKISNIVLSEKKTQISRGYRVKNQ